MEKVMPNFADAAPAVIELGPDRGHDFQQARSYFLVPLLGLDPLHGPEHYLERLAAALSAQPCTDLYVFSHGWHRNLFGAVSAYDRLVSRFTALSQRGRLLPRPEPYNPLFLALHWHSDPGQDRWVDLAGRRDKSSFLQHAQAAFKPNNTVSEGDFLNTLEDLYEYMTYVSAPNVSALNNPLSGKTAWLFEQLHKNADVHGRLAASPETRPEDKATLAWRCYEEADPQRVLVDQSEPTRPFGSPLQALSNLLKFAVAAIGFAAASGLLSNLVRWLPVMPLADHLISAPLTGLLRLLHALLPGPWYALAVPMTLVLLLLLALAILLGTRWWHQKYRKHKGARGIPVLAVGSWLPLQIALTLPLLLLLFTTFLFRTWLILLALPLYALCCVLHWGVFGPMTAFTAGCIALAYFQYVQNRPVGGLFSERMDAAMAATYGIRDTLADWSRRPIRLLKEAVSQDSQILGLADAVDRQLAFWKMQRSGVAAGQEAGIFLKQLFQQVAAQTPAALAETRIHFIGHSFGALVMTNAARYLARNTDVPLHSLTLLEAALAAEWFDAEPWCTEAARLRGALACVYSAYDSANGFYYPAANSGRMAAGYVGLCNAGNKTQCLGKDGLFASLVQPPDLAQHLTGEPPYVLNLDASRLIFAGSVAAGGGHDDIYKDDVIHMLWAITTLGQPKST
jgi:hypothetical protein